MIALSKGTPATPPIVVEDLERHFEIARGLPLLADLADQVLVRAIEAGGMEVRELWRDQIIADGHGDRGEWIYLVASGQAAVAVFDPEVLAEERSWSDGVGDAALRRKIRPQGPLIRLADRHMATFGPGELFNTRALAVDPERCAFFTTAPTGLVGLRPDWAGDMVAHHPALAHRLADTVHAARARLGRIDAARGAILDFQVREGLSVASRLRVIQVDRCIECRQCERACADRYGVPRLSIAGPRLELLAIAVTCRTCTDQRCVSVCNFDSIAFDPKRGEVVIREETCTGCASCATACPYGAIQMVRLGEPSSARFRARLEKSGALAAGGEAPRREPAEQIASKCDHCAAYGDQACVTHCPTGALVEIRPAALFQPRAVAEPPLPPEPFERGLGRSERAQAALPRRRVHGWFLWTLGILGLLVPAAELAARALAPEQSLQYRMLLADGLSPEVARFNVGYLAGSDLSLWLGYIGTALMALALLYPLRKRWRPLRRIGSSGVWFDLHLMGGTIGPLYILLHSALNLYNWVAIALWAFVAVMLSGAVGRYLVTRLPDRFAGTSLAAASEEIELSRIGGAHPQALAVARQEIERYRRFAQPRRRPGFLGAVVWLARDDLGRLVRGARCRGRLAGTAPRRIAREVSARVAAVIAAERRKAVAARSLAFLRVWVRVHVLFTVVGVIVTIAHVVAALTFSM